MLVEIPGRGAFVVAIIDPFFVVCPFLFTGEVNKKIKNRINLFLVYLLKNTVIKPNLLMTINASPIANNPAKATSCTQ